MKNGKWIVAAAFGLMSVTAVNAQTEGAKTKDHNKTEQHDRKGHKRGGRLQENVKEYEAQLNLTPAQVTQWETLNESSKQQIKALKENTSLSQEEKKAQMKTMRQARQTELQKILSEEQFAKLQEIRKEKAQERRAQRGKRGNSQKDSR
ncbi:hypothetical protein [Cesiribacter sp. SM1]|uniref:hypothetical protein n=1 Tax=Cesiribacter sp. SM1 TaxID=2861196 RepID=UPI001CD32A6D|nr:hypothetical protein [Cesiribacter sp. SM1]